GSPPSDGGNGNMGGMGAGTSDGGSTFVTGGAGGQNEGGTLINPCGTECGTEELCDGPNKGIDDDCDYEVDEGCPCSGGQATSCFKGDPSYLSNPNCNPGTMSCTELGTWGPCNGGNHADEQDLCFSADPLGCHPIHAVPFQTTDLLDGTGNFSAGADTSTFEVTCPPGVDPCPLPTGTDYTALQSGEYTVTYTKVDNGVESTCEFPLYIGAPGLRVELGWNYADGPFDLDLHMKRPMSTAAWSTSFSASNEDCMYSNCRADDFTNGLGPSWFPPANMIPDPVNWSEDPDFNLNSCYFAPEDGTTWSGYMQGCHNPRLDLDNISCDASETNPLNGGAFGFCAPENINMDYPPKNEWIRIGVHQFSHFTATTVLPNVKIFCNGALAADLGTLGFNAPFDWTAAEAGNDEIWLVADVLFVDDQCNGSQCIVQPLYTDMNLQTPVVVPVDFSGNAPNGPAYPPIP
ncbi:MAG: hypothetical protein JNK04_00755, partial [Myxococcales bacterium]|nr:hypothetical protein [Myxococcales bacterium]